MRSRWLRRNGEDPELQNDECTGNDLSPNHSTQALRVDFRDTDPRCTGECLPSM